MGLRKHRTPVNCAGRRHQKAKALQCDVKTLSMIAIVIGQMDSADSLATSVTTITDCYIAAEKGKKYAIHRAFIQDWWPELPHPDETNTIQTPLSDNALKLFLDIVYYRTTNLNWSNSRELFEFARKQNLIDIQIQIAKNSYQLFFSSGYVKVWQVAFENGLPEELTIRKFVGTRLTSILDQKVEPDYTDLMNVQPSMLILLLNSVVVLYSSAMAQVKLIIHWAQKNPKLYLKYGKYFHETVQYVSMKEKTECSFYLQNSFLTQSVREIKNAEIEKKVFHSFKPRLPENVLLYFGGATLSGDQDSVYIYDEFTRTWGEVPSLKLPQPSGYIKTVIIGSNSYNSLFYRSVLGCGMLYPTSCNLFSIFKDVFILDNNFPDRCSIQAVNLKKEPIRFRWKGAFDSERCFFSHVAYKDQIYFFGGCANRRRIATCVLFDPKTSTFTPLSDLPIGPASDTAAVLYKNNMYITGGYDDRHTLDSVVIYDPEAQAYTSGPSLKKSRSGHGAVVFNDTIYVVGGFCHGVALRTVEYFDPVRNMWLAAPSLVKPRLNLSVVVFQGKIWAIGGNHSDTDIHASVEVFDGQSWKLVNKLPKPLVTGSAIVVSTENLHIPNILEWNC